MSVRAYLTCALREVQACPVDPQRLEPAELRLLGLLDEQLAVAGFQHLGFGHVDPLLTLYGQPLAISVFVNVDMSAYALVRRHPAPEYGRLVELELRAVPAAPPNLDRALASIAAAFSELRTSFRQRGWVTPSADPRLDRFTLRGAIALRDSSRWRVFASVPTQPLHLSVEEERRLRIEADLRAIDCVADPAPMAPGKPWPLLTLIAAMALLSLALMTLLWNIYVAALIFAAVAFHEAGHATAMLLLGYRDVRVFFIPLLGAVTVGRPAVSHVRDRLAVLLAGPVPGLWLAVGLLALDLRPAALALLILNVLNLLPFTPLDGGRALEVLTRPGSVWRPAVHAVSVVGLLAIAACFGDPVIAAVGLFWALLWPRQLAAYRLRRSVGTHLQGGLSSGQIARTALEVISAPRYAGWRAATRQVTARALARLFTESVATPADRRWGIMAYLSAWIPVAAAALMLWGR